MLRVEYYILNTYFKAIYKVLYVTLYHKTSHKGQSIETEIYT